jgi:membrane-bound serine protease (ClpP class)
MRRRASFLLLIVLGLGLFLSSASAQEEGSDTFVDLIEVKGVIDPPSADYLQGRISRAEVDGAEAAIVQLDTPGGLEVSMRDMTRDILEAEIPVVVWIAPRGARAASAGTFITYSANLAYMAEATELGAATPIDIGTGETISEKVTQDAAAYIEDLAELRGRDALFARAAVEDAAAIGSAEAVERDVVNGIANSPAEVLQSMDGETVETATGTVTLETWDEEAAAPSVRIRFQDMSLMQRILHAITNPEVAFLLFLVGLFGIIFELYNPGIGLAGILGAICLLMAFYAFNVLPTNWVGVLLIALAIAFFLIDLQVAGLGVFTFGGLIALVVGAGMLYSGADPAVQLDLWAIVTAVVLTLVFFISVMTAALRVRLRRPISGEEAMIGSVAEAKTDIAPEGTVLTKGTLWRARTMETGIAAGSKVKVMATEGLVLLVEPLHEHEATEAEHTT